MYFKENLGTLDVNSRNQKGINTKAEGLNISFGGDTEARGDYRGLHTESTACWEAHQKGGRGWPTWQQGRARGGAGGLGKKARGSEASVPGSPP